MQHKGRQNNKYNKITTDNKKYNNNNNNNNSVIRNVHIYFLGRTMRVGITMYVH
jgi:hypothetical protein